MKPRKSCSRLFRHPGCAEGVWESFWKNAPDKGRVARLKNRRITAYPLGDGYAFMFWNASKGRIYTHSIVLSKEAVHTMASLINDLEKDK